LSQWENPISLAGAVALRRLDRLFQALDADNVQQGSTLLAVEHARFGIGIKGYVRALTKDPKQFWVSDVISLPRRQVKAKWFERLTAKHLR
jgi:hypothetical protein